jgi:hypothetical protein
MGNVTSSVSTCMSCFDVAPAHEVNSRSGFYEGYEQAYTVNRNIRSGYLKLKVHYFVHNGSLSLTNTLFARSRTFSY